MLGKRMSGGMDGRELRGEMDAFRGYSRYATKNNSQIIELLQAQINHAPSESVQESVERVLTMRVVDLSVMVGIVEDRGRRTWKGMLEKRGWRSQIEVAEASLHV